MAETETQGGLLESLEALFREARAARELRVTLKIREEQFKGMEEQMKGWRVKAQQLEAERARREWPGPLVSIRDLEEEQAKVAKLEAELTGWKTEAIALRMEVKKWRERREDIRLAAVAAQSSLQTLVSELTA